MLAVAAGRGVAMQSALGARATASNVAGAALTRACIGPLSRTGGNSSLAASIRMLSASAASATKAATRRGGGRRVLKLLGVTAVAGGVAGAAYAQVDEGFRRSCKFWGVAFPIFLHYRAVQSYIALRGLGDEEGDELYEVLHDRYAPIAAELTLELKGMYLKNAQLVSTRDEFMPKQYMDFCKTTQDEVPSDFKKGEARLVVEKELGRPIDEVFEYFDDECYGAASIGEVHRARLIGGQEVVVKVQYPGIEEKFRSDMTTIKAFCKIAMPQHVKPMEEVEKMFMTEFDYRGEANNLREVADNIMPEWGHLVLIPQPHDALCTKHVMVMDFVPGKQLIKAVRDQYRVYAESKGMTLEELEEEQKEKIRRGEIEKRDVHDEARRMRAIGTMVRVADVAKNSGRALYNWTVGWVAPNLEYQWSTLPINLGEILDLLNKVHAHEIFVDGAFNGDPHPGNILLCPDGRLGLIDYGQVKRITMEQRMQYARLIVALARGTRDDVIDRYIDLGVKTKYMKRDFLWRLAMFWNDRDDDVVTEGRNIQTFMDWVEENDPIEELPQDFVMAARVSVMMRGMGNAFGLRMRTAPMWLPVAENLLKENGENPDDSIPRAMEQKPSDTADKGQHKA